MPREAGNFQSGRQHQEARAHVARLSTYSMARQIRQENQLPSPVIVSDKAILSRPMGVPQHREGHRLGLQTYRGVRSEEGCILGRSSSITRDTRAGLKRPPVDALGTPQNRTVTFARMRERIPDLSDLPWALVFIGQDGRSDGIRVRAGTHDWRSVYGNAQRSRPERVKRAKGVELRRWQASSVAGHDEARGGSR